MHVNTPNVMYSDRKIVMSFIFIVSFNNCYPDKVRISNN